MTVFHPAKPTFRIVGKVREVSDKEAEMGGRGAEASRGRGEPPVIGSVDKALRVIERMSRLDARGCGLSELAADLSLNKSSLHHTLATLKARHWVEQDSDGRYHLGPASSVVAHWWGGSDRVTAALHPILEVICEQSCELVHLGILSEKFVVYVDKVEPDRAVRVWSQVGRRVAAAVTAMGRALIGAQPQDTPDIDAWLTAVPDAPPRLRGRLTDEIARVRTHGYAIEIEENEPGIACVGVPLLVVGNPVAAVSITMPVERCSHERLRDLAALIIRSVNDASPEEIAVASPHP